MKVLILIVSILAYLISVDGSLDPDSVDEALQQKERHGVRVSRNANNEDQDSADEDQQQQPKEEERGKTEKKSRNVICRGKPKIQCLNEGGSCVATGARCYGKRVPAWCTTRNCECCIPGCPEEDGFFSPPCTNQCFKYFPFGQYNWFEAKAKCQKEGLELPHPYEALKLRSYIVQRFGSSHYAFVNARGDDSPKYAPDGAFVWQDNGARFGPPNPLMRRDRFPPPPITDKYCVIIVPTANIWDGEGHVYEYQHCDWHGTAPLCELVLP